MELNIGETIKYNGVSLIIVEHKNNSCKGCFFSGRTLCPAAVSEIHCSASYRDDNKNVIFKEVEDMESRTVKLTLDKAKEFYNKGGEFRDLALSAYTKKELTEIVLPKTWDEFCEMKKVQPGEAYYCQTSGTFVKYQYYCNRSKHCFQALPSMEAAEAHLALMQLHQLRDFYRQGWEPNYTDCTCKYFLCKCVNRNIIVDSCRALDHFLTFQTEEVAQDFLNNFKDLIFKAWDLL